LESSLFASLKKKDIFERVIKLVNVKDMTWKCYENLISAALLFGDFPLVPLQFLSIQIFLSLELVLSVYAVAGTTILNFHLRK
jgi:hypothetical protein